VLIGNIERSSLLIIALSYLAGYITLCTHVARGKLTNGGERVTEITETERRVRELERRVTILEAKTGTGRYDAMSILTLQTDMSVNMEELNRRIAVVDLIARKLDAKIDDLPGMLAEAILGADKASKTKEEEDDKDIAQ
jgi:hypothetical protein